MSSRVGFGGWRKSSYSSGADNCLEIAALDSPVIGIRDSKDPYGPVLIFGRGQWNQFVQGIRDGEFG